MSSPRGAAAGLTGLLICVTFAVASARMLAQSAAWFLVFAPSTLLGLHLLTGLLKALRIPVSHSQTRSYSPGTAAGPRHPHEGLINPATGLFITGAGVDMSGSGHGAGRRQHIHN